VLLVEGEKILQMHVEGCKRACYKVPCPPGCLIVNSWISRSPGAGDPTIRYGINMGDTHRDCTRRSGGIRKIKGEH